MPSQRVTKVETRETFFFEWDSCRIRENTSKWITACGVDYVSGPRDISINRKSYMIKLSLKLLEILKIFSFFFYNYNEPKYIETGKVY